MSDKQVIEWLLQGDVSICYQVHRDLLDKDRSDLKKRIAKEGWGAKFLEKQNPDGHWGMKFYQPKWISSHYTLLDLRNLSIEPETKQIKVTIEKIATEEKSTDGGVNPAETIENSDICVNGMFLNYASYFKTSETHLRSVIDFLLKNRMKDGGYNCWSNRTHAVHSSLHSTLSVAEGIREYLRNGYEYRSDELKKAELSCREFMMLHQLYISDRTGAIINKDFLRMPYPCRWKYDFLRALDYFQKAGCEWDDRLSKGIELLISKRTKKGVWKLNAAYPGKVHFEMEKAGEVSRWNTLRALRVLKWAKVR